MRKIDPQRYSQGFDDRTTWPIFPIGAPSSFTRTTIDAGSTRVFPGPLVKGNMKNPNNWSYSVAERKALIRSKESYWINMPWNGKLTSRNIGFSDLSDSDMPNSAWNRDLVYNSCLSKLNELARGNLDLSVSLAELASTKRMIAGISKTLRFAGGYRGRGGTKEIANGWLEFNLGWRPLLSDVFQSADESVRVVLNKIQKFSASVTLPIKEDYIQTSFQLPMRREGNGKQSCRITLTLDVPSFDLSRWTSLNPVSLAWELVPMSFVVDWFFDIGSYLRNLETGLLYNTRFRSGI